MLWILGEVISVTDDEKRFCSECFGCTLIFDDFCNSKDACIRCEVYMKCKYCDNASVCRLPQNLERGDQGDD